MPQRSSPYTIIPLQPCLPPSPPHPPPSKSGHLGAVFRTVLETLRTLFVWLVDLALFYTLHQLGEAWTPYSFIQAAGFVVLVAGTLVYGRGDEAAALDDSKVEGGAEAMAGGLAEGDGASAALVPASGKG